MDIDVDVDIEVSVNTCGWGQGLLPRARPAKGIWSVSANWGSFKGNKLP